jgi:thioredoxin-dependent peroxiredoxin
MPRSALILVLLALVAVPAAAQNPATAAAVSAPLEIGAAAPDFQLPGATRFGVLQNPVRLSDFEGKTVVLAFFPRARTRGCTIQMQSYRDQYAELLHGGRNVVLIAISSDPVEELASWAREEEFPFLFASDANLEIAMRFGAIPRADASNTNRNLFVVGPDGRIAYRATPFREIDPTAYTELGEALNRLVPADVAAR